MHIRKLILLLVFTMSIQLVCAQEKSKVTLVNDTVYMDGKPQYSVKTRYSKDSLMQIHSLRSLEGKLEGMLTTTLKNDTMQFVGRFPGPNMAYNCLYPKVSLFTLMESYIHNKVMVNGSASKEGLEKYCKEREIPLRELPVKSVSRPGKDPKLDSLMAIRTKEHMDKKFTFTLKNNSKEQVSIFMGDTTASRSLSKNPNAVAFRQGRYEMVNPLEEKSLIGFEGEYVCITDSLHKLYDCRKLEKTMKSIAVKTGGKKLE
jgi:hypothetical protein